MILLWDVDAGLAQIDKYFHSNDNHVIAGALLEVGVVKCGIKNDCDPVSPSLPFFFPTSSCWLLVVILFYFVSGLGPSR